MHLASRFPLCNNNEEIARGQMQLFMALKVDLRELAWRAITSSGACFGASRLDETRDQGTGGRLESVSSPRLSRPVHVGAERIELELAAIYYSSLAVCESFSLSSQVLGAGPLFQNREENSERERILTIHFDDH